MADASYNNGGMPTDNGTPMNGGGEMTFAGEGSPTSSQATKTLWYAMSCWHHF
jgi:hypothetical protein